MQAPATAPADEQPTAATPIESPPAEGAFLRSLETLNTAVSSFNASVCLSLEVDKATAPLAAVVFTEKLGTENALLRAQAALKLAAWRQEHGEKGWAHYLQAQAMYSKALEPSTNGVVAASAAEWRLADFSRAPGEGDSPLDASVMCHAIRNYGLLSHMAIYFMLTNRRVFLRPIKNNPDVIDSDLIMYNVILKQTRNFSKYKAIEAGRLLLNIFSQEVP